MKCLFLLLILLAPCSGCMLFDDMSYDEPPYTQAQPNSCGMPAITTNVLQTAEPELLKR